MDSTKIEALQQRRQDAVAELQRLTSLPDHQRLGPKGGKGAWVQSVKSTMTLVHGIDAMLTRAKQPEEEPIGDDGLLIATIPKGRSAELRVIVKAWKGRRIVDVRVWANQSGTMKPSRKGFAFDDGKLEAAIAGLVAARPKR